MKKPHWAILRTGELAAAVALAGAIITVSHVVAERQKIATPAEAWLQVNEIFVPDHAPDQDFAVVYDATTRESFDFFRIAEVQQKTEQGIWITVCSGSTLGSSEPSAVLVNNTVTWGWLVGPSCTMPPGDYRLRVTYSLSKPGWPIKRVFVLSNVFNVRGRE